MNESPTPGSAPSFLQNLPNQITLLRMAIVPVFLVLYPIDYEPVRLFCGFLFAFAGITDYLDGFIARLFHAQSKLGAILDPVADKLLMASALVLLASTKAIYPWLAAVLMCREVAISGLRLIALERGITIAVNNSGKWKTFLLDVAMVCLIVNQPLFGWPWQEVGMVSLWLGTFLSLQSAYTYVKAFWAQAEF